MGSATSGSSIGVGAAPAPTVGCAALDGDRRLRCRERGFGRGPQHAPGRPPLRWCATGTHRWLRPRRVAGPPIAGLAMLAAVTSWAFPPPPEPEPPAGGAQSGTLAGRPWLDGATCHNKHAVSFPTTGNLAVPEEETEFSSTSRRRRRPRSSTGTKSKICCPRPTTTMRRSSTGTKNKTTPPGGLGRRCALLLRGARGALGRPPCRTSTLPASHILLLRSFLPASVGGVKRGLNRSNHPTRAYRV